MNRSIKWKIYCRSSARRVFSLLTTNKGREHFWTETSTSKGANLYFKFPNGVIVQESILEIVNNKKFCITYFGTRVHFMLKKHKRGGVILTLVNEEVPDYEYSDVHAGWVSVLMALKAYADFKVDLRNHDRALTWDSGFADN